MPFFKQQPCRDELRVQIDNYFVLRGQYDNYISEQEPSDTLTLDINWHSWDLNNLKTSTEEITQHLLGKLLDGGYVSAVRIRVAADCGHNDFQALVTELLRAIFKANSQTLKQVKLEGMEMILTDLDKVLIENNFFIQKFDLAGHPRGSRVVKEWKNTPVSGEHRFQLVQSDAVESEFVKQIEARNKTVAAYQHIEPRKRFGLSDSAVYQGAFVGLLLAMGGIAAVATVCALGLISASITSFLTAFAGPMTLAGLAVMMVVAYAPPFVMQAIMNRRNQSITREFQKIEWPLRLRYDSVSLQQASWVQRLGASPPDRVRVNLPLTQQQIDRYHHLARALREEMGMTSVNDLDPPTSNGVLVTPEKAVLVTQLLQLASFANINGPVTHLTTSTANLARDIVWSCGFGPSSLQTGMKPRILRSVEIEPVMFEPASIGKVWSFKQFVLALNPLVGRFFNQIAVAGLVNEYGQMTRMQRVNGAWNNASAIRYLDVNTAVKHLLANSVVSAELVVDSESLTAIAVACNGNSTLSELTLHFKDGGVVSEPDAKKIAQIIHRNAKHLQKISLPNMHFAEGAFAHIENALALNGAITEFEYTPPGFEPRSATIDTYLTRNRAMRFSPHFLLYLGAGAGVACVVTGLVVIAFVCNPVLAVVASSYALNLVFASWPIVGLLVGAIVGAVKYFKQKGKAVEAAENLQKLRVDNQRNPANNIEVLMSVDQYQQNMKKKLLSFDDKIDPKLRPDMAAQSMKKMLSKLEAEKNAESENTKAAKPEREMRTLDGTTELTHEAIMGLKAEAQTDVISVKRPAARFELFSVISTTKALSKQFNSHSIPKIHCVDDRQVLERIVEAYDEHRAVKVAARVAPAAR